MKKLIIRKIKNKKYLFIHDKKIGIVKQRFVKPNQTLKQRDVRVLMYCNSFRRGWHSIDLSYENNFKTSRDWTRRRIEIRHPKFKQFVDEKQRFLTK